MSIQQKPRQPVIAHTEEDWDIWCDIQIRGRLQVYPWLELLDSYETADRRDAELMWIAQRNPQFSWFVRGDGVGEAMFVRGWDWVRKRIELGMGVTGDPS